MTCWKTACPLLALNNLYTMDCQTSATKVHYYDNETKIHSDYSSFINNSNKQP